ncbi:MAG: caspase family protein [Treponema sp.]|nr:caspase family protein [Treponema sp.]
MKIKRNITALVLFIFTAGFVFGAAEDSMRRFGIFIGSNNGGRGRVVLRYAISDAVSISKVFSEMGGISAEDSVLLVEPTARDINRRIDALYEQVNQAKSINKRTEVVFYYSGHSDEDGLLLNRERYSYRELRDKINSIPSDMRIVILDSCASGAFTRLKGGAKTQPFLMDSSLTAEGYAFLTSSSADEASQESDRISASYFTHSLVAGLRGAADSVGDGRVTLNELYRFAYAETMARTETSLYGTQHPSYDMQISGTGDVVLTDIKETSAGIVFDEKLTGRLSIRNNADHLIAEITKTAARPLELGLEPGQYQITLQQGGDLLRAEFFLAEGRRTLVTRDNFTFTTANPARSRGGDEVPSRRTGVYTIFFNYINEPVRVPMVGFVNIARGNNSSLQAGFFNRNTKNFSGVQAGYANTTGGSLNGLQAGFVNYTAGDTKGLQAGFVNFNSGNAYNLQAGFVNTTAGNRIGLQAGFVNATTGDLKGLQTGFVNLATGTATGMQAGFVNVVSQEMKGPQFGFINYADSMEGIPVGFISIVRKGGYHAVEYSFSEFYPITTGLKLGIDRFYTTIFTAYDPVQDNNNGFFAAGFGIGTIVPISRLIFFNAELNSLSPALWSMSDGNARSMQIRSLSPSVGFKLGRYFSITAGPSLTWVRLYSSTNQWDRLSFEIQDYNIPDTPVMPKPLFSIYSHDINDRNRLVIGARAAVRLHF